MMKTTLALTGLALALLTPAHAATTSTFDDLPLAANSAFLPGSETQFTSGAARFSHHYTDYGFGCCWNGWTYSNQTDTTTAGFENQYSAFAGSGAQGSSNYGVAFLGEAELDLSGAGIVHSVALTNTTYTALSMRDGDAFAKQFGGASGDDADFLKLTITGIDDAGLSTGSVDFYLADYRYADQRADYIVRDWTAVDLSSLGIVSGLRFQMSSSDNGRFGMNTPAYFALDDLSVTAVPEPSTTASVLTGLLALALARKRRG